MLLGAVAYGGHLGYDWWTDGRFLVSTDDAYVQGDITVLASKMIGYVTDFDVDNNQRVRAGDVIARIDDGDYRLALEAAQNRWRPRRARSPGSGGRSRRRRRASHAPKRPGRRPGRADPRRGRVRPAEPTRKYRLHQPIEDGRGRLGPGPVTRFGSCCRGELAAEHANVDVLHAQQAEAERVAGELRTAVAKAERDLSFTTVRAPLDGVVGNKAVQVGAYVKADTRLAALVPLQTVHVDANFKETQLDHLRPGQTVRLRVDAFPDREITGTVESIAAASGAVFSLLPPENATGNFTKIVQRVPVRIAVDPAVLDEGLLRPGLSVVASVDTRTGPADQQQAAGP